jgi:hypothetical protein
MSEEKIQGTTMAGAANETLLNPSNAAPMPAARKSMIEILAERQGDVDSLDTGEVVLGLKKPLGSAYLRSIELAEGNASLTPFFEAMLCIVAVNGTPQPAPRNKDQIYALADVIGRASIDSLLAWYQEKTMPEVVQVLKEHQELTPGSPEFMALVQELRAAKAKK